MPSPELQPYQHVDITNDDYLDQQQELFGLSSAGDGHNVFGASEIRIIDRNERVLEVLEPENSMFMMAEADNIRQLNNLRGNLAKFVSPDVHPEYQSKLNDELNIFCIETGREKLTLTSLVEGSDELILDFARNHVERFRQTLQEKAEQYNEFRKRFWHLASTAIAEGRLPITVERLHEGLKTVQIKSHDYLSGSLSEVLGDYSAFAHRIRLVEGNDPELAFKIFAHEMFHALSGKTIIREPATPEDPTFESFIHRHQRVGLRIQGVRGRDKFKWLNEAVTESLLETIGLEPHTYEKYRTTLEDMEGLMRRGGTENPRALIYAAYFEDYDTRSKKDKVPAWKAMDKAVRRSLFAQGSGIVAFEALMKSSKHSTGSEQSRLTLPK
jgi:hypothetical protein